MDDFDGKWYRVAQASVVPGPVQSPRPPIVIGANHARMLHVAAKRADVWNTWGGYGIDESSFLELTRERARIIDRACEELIHLGRDPETLLRSVLVHHGAFDPWSSTHSFRSIAEAFTALGFSECIMYWPQPHERAVFDQVVTDVIPDLRT